MVNNNSLFIGLYEKALPNDFKWGKKLNLANEAGYNFMEVSIDESDERIERLKWDRTKKERLRKLATDAGVHLLTICLSANRRFPIASSYKDIQKKGMEIMQDTIWFAFSMGVRIVQVAGYDVLMGEEKSSDESKEKFKLNLMSNVNLASKLGVTLAIENVDSEFGISIKNLIYFINAIQSPWLQLYPDFGNLAAMNQNVPEQLKIGKSHIVAVHVKDTKEGIVRRVPYGDGIVDFISSFKVLKEIGFNGPFLLEIWADDRKDNYKIIKKSREWVCNKLKKVWN
jgi:predicted hexulose-6-phosphate isomerase